MPSPVIQVVNKLPALLSLTKVMQANGLGHLRKASPRDLVSALRRASPEVRKAVSRAAAKDLSSIEAELARLSKLRDAVKGSDPQLAESIAARARRLSQYATALEYRMPFYRQTGWDRVKRLGGIGLNTFWGASSLYDAYDNLRDGNYGAAAYHLAVAPLFGLGSVANHASRKLSMYGKAPALARALSAFGTAERKMVSAGKYGTSGTAATRWMMRHPFITTEIGGTMVGAPTMLSAFTGIGGGAAEPPTNAEDPSSTAHPYNRRPYGWDKDTVASFRGVKLTQGDVDRLSAMDDYQLMDWLREKGFGQ